MASIQTFNNSLVFGESKYDGGVKMTDLNHIYTWYRKESFSVYKGLMSLFNQRKLMCTPILNMTELQKEVIDINGLEGSITYDIPIELEGVRVIEDMSRDIAKPGIDGQKFKIKFSEPTFTNTDIITYNLRDGMTLYVTEDEIYQEGDGWVYTVMIPQKADNKNKYFNKRWLQPGTQYLKITNVNGEHDTQKSNISNNRTGLMHLRAEFGGHRSVYHWITGYADMMNVSAEQSGNDPRFLWAKQYGADVASKVFTVGLKDKEGKLVPNSGKWMNMIETLLFAEMKMMEENDIMWNKGGVVEGAGRRSVRVNTGLYEQLRNGNRVQYSKLTLKLFEDILGRMYYNSGIPFEERRTVIQTGTGGMIEISKLLYADFNATNPFLVTAGDVKGYLYGDSMHLGYGFRFTTKRFPTAGEVVFEYNPALDSRWGRQVDQLQGEFPIESYTFMILDITDPKSSNAYTKGLKIQYRVDGGQMNSGANIALVRPRGWEGVMWGYEIGTQHPMGKGAMNGMTSSSQRDGYAIWMKSFSSVFVKDATKTLIIEKIRPEY